jgi:hypothetical protein
MAAIWRRFRVSCAARESFVLDGRRSTDLRAQIYGHRSTGTALPAQIYGHRAKTMPLAISKTVPGPASYWPAPPSGARDRHRAGLFGCNKPFLLRFDAGGASDRDTNAYLHQERRPIRLLDRNYRGSAALPAGRARDSATEIERPDLRMGQDLAARAAQTGPAVLEHDAVRAQAEAGPGVLLDKQDGAA